jgi:1-aminocyclopropane-1-carboxylate deaminase
VKSNWELIADYHFGGYGKINEELVRFINDFYQQTKIPLDPVYTGKMMYGIVELISKGYFPKGAKILAIHTGGLQGIKGMNNYLKNKNLQQIITQ